MESEILKFNLKMGKKKIIISGINIYLLIIFTTIFICFRGSMDGAENPGYLIKAWMIEDGLPQNSILSIRQTHDSYLWLGTQLGLVRFDGLLFPVYNQWNTPSLKNNRIVCLFEDTDNRLWIGTGGGGLSCLYKNHWTNFQTRDGLSSNHIKSVFQDRKGTIWVGTDSGLDVIKSGRINTIIESDKFGNNPVNCIGEDNRQNLWIASGNGILFKKNELPNLKQSFKKILDITAHCLWTDRSAGLWIGTEKGLKLIRNEKNTSPIPEAAVLDNIPVTALFKDKNGILWIGTYGNGVYLLRDRIINHFSTSNGLTDNFIHDIFGDNENNIWIGTYTGGIIRLKPRIISDISVQNGLPENTVTSILQDRQGSFWIGTRHHGLCKYQKGKISIPYSIGNGLLSNQISALFQTKSGNLWVGTESGGLNFIGQNGIHSYTMKQNLISESVTAIHQDSSGILWIGTTGGLNRYINDTIHTQEEFRGNNIRTFLEDRSGILWIGTQTGLFTIKEGQVKSIDFRKNASAYDVLALHESLSEPGVIWAGTNGLGLLRMEKGNIAHFTMEEGLYNNYIFSITETSLDSERYLWCSSFTGIFRISFDSIRNYLEKETDNITSAIFDESDGMNSSECVGGVQPSSMLTKEGDIWIPTIKGVAIIKPHNLPVKRKPIPVIIEDFIIDNESFIHKKNPSISSGKQMFEFYFTALDFSAPKNIKFRYRLEGFEDKWATLDTGQKRTALYFNLNSGLYCFQVKACDHLGNWNEQAARFSFRIRSDFKENLLVYIPRVLIILFFLAGFLIWRLQKKKPDQRITKYRTSALTEDRADEILQKLLTVMEEEKIYLKPDLTMKKLSEKIMTHPNHISQIVNEKLKQSYNDFINTYRIEEAKAKLLNPSEKDKSILEVAYDVGFYSKSVFNTAFKKFTGMTPSEFKQKYLNHNQ